MRARLLGLMLLAGAIPALALAQSGAPYSSSQVELVAVTLEPVSGTVRIRESGRWEVLRRRASAFENFTLIDARHGRVRLIGAGRAVASGGMFDFEYDTEGVLVMRLRGGSFATACAKASISAATDRGKRSVRRLWADGHGRFRTRGRYSAATVRGTRWLVEDRCEGTLTEVARGEVDVEDFTVPAQPTPTPAPSPSPAPEGASGPSGGQGAPAPAAAPTSPSKDAVSKPRRVRIKRGQRYIAGPAR
jgi:hypothetical protein